MISFRERESTVSLERSRLVSIRSSLSIRHMCFMFKKLELAMIRSADSGKKPCLP
jgi:hypothetical protein